MNIRLLGIPSNAGSAYSGTELTPAVIRQLEIVEKLRVEGLSVVDLGDISLPDFMPRHNSAPVRNYPGPRIVWDLIKEKQDELFAEKDFTIIFGGDCSIVVGTASALYEKFGPDIHILFVDAHIDNLSPNADRCVGAAAMGIWFLSNENMMWEKPKNFNKSNYSIFGVQDLMNYEQNMNIVTLEEIQKNGLQESISRLLSEIPTDSKIFIHFDVDVMDENSMPAAYIPSKNGFSYEDSMNLLKSITHDPRVIGIEITEFSGLKDIGNKESKKIIDMLIECAKVKRDQYF